MKRDANNDANNFWNGTSRFKCIFENILRYIEGKLLGNFQEHTRFKPTIANTQEKLKKTGNKLNEYYKQCEFCSIRVYIAYECFPKQLLLTLLNKNCKYYNQILYSVLEVGAPILFEIWDAIDL